MKTAHGLCTSLLLGAAMAGAALAPAARSQGGGFTAGDLYLAGNIGLPGPHALVRVDPLSGDSAVIKQFSTIIGGTESLVFDSYRQRLVLMARLSPADGILWRPYLVDASGAFAPLEPPVAMWHGFSPTGDGRIYFRDQLTDVTPFKWLDAANQIHVLYDTDGITPFLMGGFHGSLEDMLYVASENALITVNTNPGALCPGGNALSLHVRKLPLSADGTRLSGPMSCSEFDMDPAGAESSHGLSLMADGDVLLGSHSGLYGPPLPRLVRIDPSTLAMSAFASFGDASNGGITWSTALGKAVTQTHFISGLRAYAAGQVNNGAVVPSSIAFSDTRYAIDEIPTLACDGGWIAYGKGLAGAGGLVPRLYGKGCPEPGALFHLELDQIVGGAGGALFVSLSTAAVPFKGGALHLGPVLLTLNLTVGGTPGLAGAGSLSLPAALPPIPALSGTSVYLQAAFSDAAAVKNVSLTQGLELEIG